MTIAELQERLRAAHERIGYAGRFSFTVSQGTASDCYVTWWGRAETYGPEDCKTVGSGSFDECLFAVERFVRTFADRTRKKPTQEQLDATLGLAVPVPAALAAE